MDKGPALVSQVEEAAIQLCYPKAFVSESDEFLVGGGGEQNTEQLGTGGERL